MCECLACMYGIVFARFQVYLEAGREHWIPWNWNYDSSKSSYGCWEQNSGSVQKQEVLLIVELFLQPRIKLMNWSFQKSVVRHWGDYYLVIVVREDRLTIILK